MGKQYTRAELLARLRAVRNTGAPILAVCTGSGLHAKLCDLGGADLITLVHTGLVRHKGLPSIAALDRPTNQVVREMMADQFHATAQIPIIAGINVSELLAGGDLNELIDSFLPRGFSGIMNYPTAGEVASAEFVEMVQRGSAREEYQLLQRSSELEMLAQCRQEERDGVGYARELALVRTARQRDIFTIVYAFTPPTGRGYGPRRRGLHLRTLRRYRRRPGGPHGNREPQVGGPFSEPEDTAFLYQYSQATALSPAPPLTASPLSGRFFRLPAPSRQSAEHGPDGGGRTAPGPPFGLMSQKSTKRRQIAFRCNSPSLCWFFCSPLRPA